MSLGFPSSPTNGATYTISGVTYTYNAAHNVWQLTPANGVTNLSNNPTASSIVVGSSSGASTTLPAASATLAGVMSASDKTKLDTLPADTAALTEIAQDAAAALFTSATHTGVTTVYDDTNGRLTLVVTDTNLALGAATATTQPITNSRGTGITLPAATTSAAGLLTSLDKTKLDALPADTVAFTEAVQDAAASLLTSGTHVAVIVTYNDAGNVVNLSVPSALVTVATVAPSSPAIGARWHNTALNQRFEWDGSTWVGY